MKTNLYDNDNANTLIHLISIYSLLASFARSVRQAMDRVFSSFYGPSTKHAGHKNKEGKNELLLLLFIVIIVIIIIIIIIIIIVIIVIIMMMMIKMMTMISKKLYLLLQYLARVYELGSGTIW